MRVLPTDRRVGRLNPQPQAKAAVARLLARQWWYGRSDGVSTARAVTPSIPAAARWAVARAIGSGGGESVGNGSGACFARRLFPMRPGQTLQLSIGAPRQAGSGADGQASVVLVDGVAVCLAVGGLGGAAGHAAAPPTTDCIGDVIRPGEAAGLYTGGASGSDLGDPDTLWLGGQARRDPSVARVMDGTQPPILSDFGAGAFTGPFHVPAASTSVAWEPVARASGTGVIVLEFYDRRPY